MICATGVSFDLALRSELDGIVDDIALWSDRFAPGPDEAHPELGKLPYLGKSYEFHRYDGVGHAFFNTWRDGYRTTQALDGWEKVFGFYQRHLTA